MQKHIKNCVNTQNFDNVENLKYQKTHSCTIINFDKYLEVGRYHNNLYSCGIKMLTILDSYQD